MKQAPEVVIKSLGKRVRELRQTTGVSQEAFADSIGLDRTYISGIERGVLNPSIRNIARIAAKLDVGVAVLFGCSGKCLK
jgi:transcriptional regulator with XRE-family HTH domain